LQFWAVFNESGSDCTTVTLAAPGLTTANCSAGFPMLRSLSRSLPVQLSTDHRILSAKPKRQHHPPASESVNVMATTRLDHPNDHASTPQASVSAAVVPTAMSAGTMKPDEFLAYIHQQVAESWFAALFAGPDSLTSTSPVTTPAQMGETRENYSVATDQMPWDFLVPPSTSRSRP